MRKGLKFAYCLGCKNPIWKKPDCDGIVEGWCYMCKKFYTFLIEQRHAVQTEFLTED